MFYIYLTDPEFDNDDSPYGKIMLRLKKEVMEDNPNLVPLNECSDKYTDYWTANNKVYCPEFRDSDYLNKNYYYNEHSQLQLTVMECNKTERNAIGKECKSE